MSNRVQNPSQKQTRPEGPGLTASSMSRLVDNAYALFPFPYIVGAERTGPTSAKNMRSILDEMARGPRGRNLGREKPQWNAAFFNRAFGVFFLSAAVDLVRPLKRAGLRCLAYSLRRAARRRPTIGGTSPSRPTLTNRAKRG
jgi:hypothetical protein